MYNIIAQGKEFKLSNEQVVIVIKISLRQYYLLIASLLIYKNALMNISKVKYKTIQEYIEFMRNNSLDIAKVKVEFNNIVEMLKDCVLEIDVTKQEQHIIIELINHTLVFNSVSMGVGGKEFVDIDELNEELEARIGIICGMIKLTPDKVLEMSNYDVCILMREYNRQRVHIINDIRLAYHGEKNDYIKYTKGLMGEIVYTGEEIFKDPGILKRMAH